MKPISLFFGLLFLVNAEIAYVFDLAPDFIGYIIILSALKKLSLLDGKIYAARQGALRLFWFSLIKFVLSLFIPTFSDMNMLLAVFSFAVIELILLLPFINKLFGGLDYLVSRHGSEKTLKKSKATTGFLYFFFTTKEILWVIPTAVPLFDPKYSGDYKYYFVDFQNLKKGASALVFIITSLLAVAAIIMIAKYLFAIRADKPLKENIDSLYFDKVLSNSGLKTRIALSKLLLLLSVGCVFLANVYIDSINLIPSMIGYFIIFITAFRCEKFKIPLALISFFGFVCDAFAYFYRAVYVISGKDIADFTSPLSITAGALNAAVMCSVLIMTAILLYKLTVKYAAIKLLKEFVCFTVFSVLASALSFVFYTMPSLNEYVNFPGLVITFFYLYYIFSFTSKSKAWFEKAIS